MKKFVHEFVSKKIDECDLTIKELEIAMDEQIRREAYVKKNSPAHYDLAQEFANTMIRKLRVINAKHRLLMQYVKLEMDEYLADPKQYTEEK